jgi:hypothetical protein
LLLLLELELELELLLELELELLLEFELELLLEFELEFLLELEDERPLRSSLVSRIWLPPVSGRAERSLPGPMKRLMKLTGPSSATAGPAAALADTKVAAMSFFRDMRFTPCSMGVLVLAPKGGALGGTPAAWPAGLPARRRSLTVF